MPQPRKPSAIHELTGSYKVNPGRRNRSEPKAGDIGPPPKHLTAQERAVWAELVSCIAPGVLMSSDAHALELLARLIAQSRTDAEFPASKLNTAVALIGRFGMTPGDRTKIVAAPPEQEDNPAAQFFN
jgi:hypothetical protein